MNADGSGVVQLTHTNGDDSHPHWSADGSRIMFNSSHDTNSALDWSKQWHELFSMKLGQRCSARLPFSHCVHV
jgi:Tol biopolymer transport system component